MQPRPASKDPDTRAQSVAVHLKFSKHSSRLKANRARPTVFDSPNGGPPGTRPLLKVAPVVQFVVALPAQGIGKGSFYKFIVGQEKGWSSVKEEADRQGKGTLLPTYRTVAS